MKRAYYVSVGDGESGVAVIANTAKEAKKISFGHECLYDCEWTEIEVKWKKGIKVDHLPIGIIDDLLEALKLGVYDWVEEIDCPKCKSISTRVYNDEGKIYCSECEEVKR